MLELLHSHLELPGKTLALAIVAVLLAGMVRGFAGFGLSAFIMASLAVLIPPISLIPICFLLEALSSLIMSRGGLSNGNRGLALSLIGGYTVGLPLGLTATSILPVDVSRLVALILILLLAMLQLLKVPAGHLRWPGMVLAAGLLAGIGTGLASIGGMVVALYVLSMPMMSAREIRGSLVLFLLASMVISGFWLSVTGTLDLLAMKRALFLAPAAVVGVLAGIWLFRPSLEPLYKRFCLLLLISVAAIGLVRVVLA